MDGAVWRVGWKIHDGLLWLFHIAVFVKGHPQKATGKAGLTY